MTRSFPIPTLPLDTTRLVLVARLFNRRLARAPHAWFHGQIDGHAVHALQVADDTLIQPFGHFLPLLWLLQQLLVRWIAQEGNLREDRRHVRADEHNERRFPHAARSEERR